MKINTINLSLGFAAIVCTFILLLEIKPSPKPVNFTGLTKQMDSFLKDATYYEYDAKGSLHSTIQSPHITHIPYQNTTYIQQPALMIYSDQHIPWYVTADHGKSLNGAETLYLWGHVKLHQPPKPNYPETTITTTRLTVFPKKSIAQTDQPVTIRRPDATVKAVGLVANIKTQVIHLLSKSEGVYDAASGS